MITQRPILTEMEEIMEDFLSISYRMPLDATGLYRNFMNMCGLLAKQILGLDNSIKSQNLHGDVETANLIDSLCLFWVEYMRNAHESRLEPQVVKCLTLCLLDLHDTAIEFKKGVGCRAYRNGLLTWIDERLCKCLDIDLHYV